MEHLKDIKTIAFNGQWSDVGSWSSVADLSTPDQNGNKILGDGLALDTTGTYINAPFRKVVTLGVKNLLVIDTPDAVLIASQESAQSVKDVVQALESEQDEKTLLHRKVKRPWGWYDRIDQGERFQVKRIAVNPGASLSLQKHHHRAEHWIVVKGRAEVTCGKDTYFLSENQSTYIPVGEIHRLHNPEQTVLEMIEVQSGNYLGEDDIVRLDDSYGRG
jgi:mannose-1-phosphate guanylyltransferase/mannose-6-phosphate isomerase